MWVKSPLFYLLVRPFGEKKKKALLSRLNFSFSWVFLSRLIHYITLHCIALHCITLHYITLHCIKLHCITLHYITLHYITLHYITCLANKLRFTHGWGVIPMLLITNSMCKKIQTRTPPPPPLPLVFEPNWAPIPKPPGTWYQYGSTLRIKYFIGHWTITVTITDTF